TGQYATALRHAGFDGRIVSFEPLTQAHARLIRVADGDPLWTIAPRMAIGAAHGETTIHVSAESDMSSILPLREDTERKLASSRYIGRETIPMRTLDELWDDYADSAGVFVKIDTQGYEDKVLDGLGERIDAVRGAQLELALTPLYEGETLYRDMLDRLARHELTPHLIIPGYYSRHHQRMLQFDAVFFRELV
ncbi:MAG: FkbM family methyltransferase, partial [Gammaproteobacteria bacterium]